MMPTAIAATTYLPTDVSVIDSPWTILGFIAGVVIFIGSIVYMIVADEDPFIIFFGLMFGMMAAIMPVMLQSDWVNQQNKDNLIANVKTVYEIDGVKVEEESPLTKLGKNEPISVTVTSGSKAYKLLLSQNNETFEPSLSSYENDSIDISKLKKER